MDTSATKPFQLGGERGPYRRILVYGVTGSGKTTTARQLSKLTGIPLTEVDDLTWDPGWTEVPKDVQMDRITKICDGDEWILDAAYGKWIDIPLQRVTLIVGLDYSRARSFLQLLKRTVRRSITKEQVCNGNTESLGKMLTKDSLLLWHYKSFLRKRERINEWAKNRIDIQVVVFKSPRQLERWMMNLIVEEITKREDEF